MTEVEITIADADLQAWGQVAEPVAVSFNSAAMPDAARVILRSLPGARLATAPGMSREVLYIGAAELVPVTSYHVARRNSNDARTPARWHRDL